MIRFSFSLAPAMFISVIPPQSPLYVPALIALSLAVVSGLTVLYKHSHIFREFELQDLREFRLDAIFYVLVCLSTALCLVDLALQTVGLFMLTTPETIFSRQAFVIGFVHSGFGLLSLCLHMVVSKMLSNEQFCSLCQRPL